LPLACLSGRFHAYEGHPAPVLARPIRILKGLGVERLILTNAAGGLKPDFPAGTLMILDDHINFSGINPLIGANDARMGPRFFDMSRAYDKALRDQMKSAAATAGMAVKSGVYVFCQGPNFETPAEVRMLAMLGGDAVGMSTVPECLAAIHCGMKVAGLSIITNLAAGLSDGTLSHDETLAEGAKAYARVELLLVTFFKSLAA
jgi:inosine/guanosine/xanthosine phosphorylase family protein